MGRIMAFPPRILRAYPAMVEGLDTPERVLLLGLRWWVADARQGADPLPRLSAAMRAVEAPDAAASLDMLMHVIARTARRTVGLGCPRCPRLAADEQRLLHAARLAQDREPQRAEETLSSGMLSSTGAEFALGPLEGLGELFAEAGLVLRPRALPEPGDLLDEAVTAWAPALPPTLH